MEKLRTVIPAVVLSGAFLVLLATQSTLATDVQSFQAEGTASFVLGSNAVVGSGYIAGVGAYTLTGETIRVGDFTPCRTIYGPRTLATAKGSLLLFSSGIACLSAGANLAGGSINADLEWVVTGGTGVFANAHGSGTETAQIALLPFQEHFSGTLSY